MHPALLPLFNPKVQDYLIAMFAIDPVEAVRKANTDTLIVQGERDLQVSVADARLLDKAPKTKLRLIAHMNHVLKDAPEDRGRKPRHLCRPHPAAGQGPGEICPPLREGQ